MQCTLFTRLTTSYFFTFKNVLVFVIVIPTGTASIVVYQGDFKCFSHISGIPSQICVKFGAKGTYAYAFFRFTNSYGKL